jgi:hypothetical protein
LSTTKDSNDKQENKQSRANADLKNDSSFDSLDDDIPF